MINIYIILRKYLLYCEKDLIDLHYKLSELHLMFWKYQHLNQIAYSLLIFGSLN